MSAAHGAQRCFPYKFPWLNEMLANTQNEKTIACMVTAHGASAYKPLVIRGGCDSVRETLTRDRPEIDPHGIYNSGEPGFGKDITITKGFVTISEYHGRQPLLPARNREWVVAVQCMRMLRGDTIERLTLVIGPSGALRAALYALRKA
ncbi:hypothetical protein N7457_004659 [Penicillium paradoxum]|uniref:uncharacterized protein n=1 Tax=Penicillium paradoxum TaxID=176176 RepID=UPI002548392E|nr:uncharacterized protein N7457_004659 [Penicillium paradoxum]KAJ5782885.1 hypothetical protein N7457_004659 [Penicillium paradoxum]